MISKCTPLRIGATTPYSDIWDPHLLHFADAKSTMMDSNGDIVGSRKCDRTMFEEVEVEVSKLYAEPCMWDYFQQLVDDQLNDACDLTTPLSDDDVAMMAIDGIRAQVASISSVLEQSVFSTTMNDQAMISKLAMAVGSTTIDDTACEVFEAMVPIWDIYASAYLLVDRMA
jgi:hypothetical protein